MSHGGGRMNRRRFLGGGLAAAAAFTIVPSYVLGGNGRRAPSDVLTRAVIGLGRGNGFVLPNQPDGPMRTLAVCDVDRNRMQAGVNKAGRGCEGFTDWRRIMDMPGVDVVYIMTPPHWHALQSIAAAQAGKDIYCEKPMTRFIGEGQAVIDAVERYGRIFQIGTFGRFRAGRLKKLIDSGLLGGPLTVRVTARNGFNWKVREWSGQPDLRPQPVPSHLDWDLYQGPAPQRPYHRHRTHMSFRGYWDYDGGGLADMGEHYLDPVLYALGKDGTSPVEIEASAQPAHHDAVRLWAWVRMRYADGTTLIFESGEWGEPLEPEGGAYIEGPNGKVFQNGRTDPEGLYEQAERMVPDAPRLVDFEEGVRTRQTCGGNARVSHRSATVLHLANIAIRMGRPIRYDPAAQQIVGDEQANRLIHVPMRAPWHL